jgi:formylglycine-generating enzyme required for sulfatase activity
VTLVLLAQWVVIPAGAFVMGCEPKIACPEKAEPHTVTFERPFEMMRTEVTVAQFRAFVKATGHRTDAEKAGERHTWSSPRAYKLGERLPVAYVSMNDAAAYCSWAGGRLPTESEWTYAFRAGSTVRGHLWWDTDGRYVWYRENSKATPHAVATRLPNAWGLYDMEGNVWEWTRSDPGEKYPGMIRGGSWIVCPRIEGAPGETGLVDYGPFTRCPSSGAHIRDDVGFRCVR